MYLFYNALQLVELTYFLHPFQCVLSLDLLVTNKLSRNFFGRSAAVKSTSAK